MTNEQKRESEELTQARNRFFPGWWAYSPADAQYDALRPLYRVIVTNPKELSLAQKVQPETVRAVFIYDQAA